MTIYKLRHKPTGLFYTPTKGNGNLSFTGKLCTQKPNPSQYFWVKLQSTYFGETRLIKTIKTAMGEDAIKTSFGSDRHLEVKPEDWEVIEISEDKKEGEFTKEQLEKIRELTKSAFDAGHDYCVWIEFNSDVPDFEGWCKLHNL